MSSSEGIFTLSIQASHLPMFPVSGPLMECWMSFLLCIVVELGELLDPTAYVKQHRDHRELEHEQLSMIYARGLARELLGWWGSLFVFSR